MICVSLGNISFEEAIKIAREAEMVEIRADLLGFTGSEYERLINEAKKAIFTCRKTEANANIRNSLFSLAIKNACTFIDLEIESTEELLEWLLQKTEGSDTEIIISYHNYQETPDFISLEKIYKSCFKLGADVAKIACMVNSDEDLVNLIRLYRKQGRKVIIGMGEKAILSRVAAPVLGAEFTFASADNGMATAPGQLSVMEMQELFNIMKIQ